MDSELEFRRRVLLRLLTGGGTLACTLLARVSARFAIAAPSRGTLSTMQAGPITLPGPIMLPGVVPVVVIDPGHGGHDPGAVGLAGTLEKDVTLASAVAFKSALESSGRYRVELTRTDDRYVRREDRVDIARALGANLFLSMHADTMSDPAVRGASVYTLAKGASDAATEALANRENGLLPGGDAAAVAPEVSEILANLAAREMRATSARIAHQLISDLGRELPVLPSPERHADFTVLHTAGIPSVLIEMGFLSNQADEAALNEAGHRDQIARAMTRSVDAWFAVAHEGARRGAA
jgi:N-acetylmuramoyl-L-alanine amidase